MGWYFKHEGDQFTNDPFEDGQQTKGMSNIMLPNREEHNLRQAILNWLKGCK